MSTNCKLLTYLPIVLLLLLQVPGAPAHLHRPYHRPRQPASSSSSPTIVLGPQHPLPHTPPGHSGQHHPHQRQQQRHQHQSG